MSNISSTQTNETPLWKHGKRGNNIEFANIKQLEKQEPSTYKLIEWREGFSVKMHIISTLLVRVNTFIGLAERFY